MSYERHTSIERHNSSATPDRATQQSQRTETSIPAREIGDLATPGAILALQRTIGNAAVNQLLRQHSLRAGAYNSSTPHGPHVMAHEAPHTVRQPVPMIQRQPVVGLGLAADEDIAAAGNLFAEADAEVEAADRRATFHQFDPALDQYAKRAEGYQNTDRFRDVSSSPILQALTLPRGPNGALTQAAIDALNRYEQDNIAKLRQNSASSKLKINLPTNRSARKKFLKQLRQTMAQHTNTATNDTAYPELRNVTEAGISPNHPVAVTTNLDGVSVTVSHDLNDANASARLQSVHAAIRLIKATGIAIPPMTLNLPRYGRTLEVSPTCTIAPSSSTERAIFIPPNFLHVSSENQNNPLTDKVQNVRTGADEFKFSSTGFDPSGVGTIVHEIGHFLHYHNSPSKFHGLALSAFKGAANVETAAAEVSQYGTKPREFVAEVFLGLIYGKNYSNDVMKMYKAFGGMMPPSMAAKYAYVPEDPLKWF